MAVGRAVSRCQDLVHRRARWLCESVGGSASATPPGLDGVGSVTCGVGLTLLGLCYAAIRLVAAQISTSAPGALGLAGAAISIGYLVPGVGAVQDSVLVWASHFGWAQRVERSAPSGGGLPCCCGQ
jgi:ABC-2 type transport system permease protein